ncbi:DUF7689 domain-containing protein [Faucicola boevrei]|uniref:DUF7689 domain-containing protein n=1 Tax=Faucicola boevrei TaxID=346665 RepID=UPI00035CC7D9|nr:hypothetical protein [Moraxella boevrei]
MKRRNFLTLVGVASASAWGAGFGGFRFSLSPIPGDPYPKCNQIPSYDKPLDKGARIVYKSFFPNLNVDTARETSFSTQCYNCISWTLGITDDWVWPLGQVGGDTSVADFDAFYQKHGIARATDATADIALWGQTTPSGHVSATHGSIVSHAPLWESKLGLYIRMRHGKDDLVGEQYGKIIAYYKKDATATQKLLATRQKLLSSRQPLSLNEYQKINQAVKKLPLRMQQTFDHLYTRWQQKWFDGAYAIDSNPYTRRHIGEYQMLIDLGAEMGEAILPLVVSRMVSPENIFGIVLYDELQKNPRLKAGYGDDFNVIEGEVARALLSAKKYITTFL